MRRAAAGFLLLPIALLLVVVAALALGMNRVGTQAAGDASRAREATAARLVAEAGLEHALWRANRNSCADYDLPATPFRGSTYEVSFTPDAGSPVSVVASATTAGGATARIARDDVPVYNGVETLALQPGPGEGVDTYLDQNALLGSNGASLVLSAQPPAYRPLLRFDLSAVPVGATIVAATLELYQTLGSGAAGASIDAFRVTSDWTEGTGLGQVTGDGATWSRRDAVNNWVAAGGDHATRAVASMTDVNGVGWKSWDLTALVGQWVSGRYPNQGVLLKGVGNVYAATFHSSDALTAGLRPKLTLTYFPCRCDGNTGTLLLKPGADGADTHIDEKFNLVSHGGEAILVLDGKSGQRHRVLLRFDPSWLPPAAIVRSATLTLEPSYSNGSPVVDVYRVTSAWGEGDGTTGGGCYQGASWIHRDECVAWTAPGGDHDATVLASAAVPYPLSTRSFDVTSTVAAMHDGTLPNFGFMLRVNAGNNSVGFHSGEAADAALHPALAIEYTCPCGADCTPGPPPAAGYHDAFPLACDEPGADAASTGTEDWSPWSWQEVAEADGWCAGGARIGADLGDQALRLSGHGAGAERELDLSAFDAAYLVFEYRFASVLAGNSLRVQVSANGGGNWNELSPIAGPASHADDQRVLYDISAYRSANTRIRFIADLPVTGGTDVIHVDEVNVTSVAPAGVPRAPMVLAPSADTWVYEHEPLDNYGSATTFTAGKDDRSSGKHQRALLRFDVSALPAGATVQSVVVKLYVTGGVGGSVALAGYRSGVVWTESLASWTTTLGGTPVGPALVSGTVATGSPGWVEVSLPPALVQEWLDGVSVNNGFVLLSVDGRNRGALFASRENSTVEHRPRMVVTYSE